MNKSLIKYRIYQKIKGYLGIEIVLKSTKTSDEERDSNSKIKL